MKMGLVTKVRHDNFCKNIWILREQMIRTKALIPHMKR